MTRDQFIDGYLERSGLEQYRTPDGFHTPWAMPKRAVPCRCGEAGCQGWIMGPAKPHLVFDPDGCVVELRFPPMPDCTIDPVRFEPPLRLLGPKA